MTTRRPVRSASDPRRGLPPRRGPVGRLARRRGVASILAMMFIVLFGSLAATMAVVARSNLRTADSHVKVSRAMSAAETGLVLGVRRLEEQARRFVVERGVIDQAFAEDLWTGGVSPDDFDLLDPTGYTEPSPPAGIMQALAYQFTSVDGHSLIVDSGDALLPLIDTENGVLELRPIGLEDEADPPHFRLRFEMLALTPAIRVISTGFDDEVSRRVQIDIELGKRIEYAALSPNRLMIGKNVLVEGPLGSLYGIDDDRNANPDELDLEQGDPIVMRSDFYDLDPDLDDLLDLLYGQIALHDRDGDNRLRPGHPDEAVGLAGNPELVDYDGNEFVEDFDLFLAFFDADGDGRVCYDSARAAAAGLPGLTDEYGSVAGEDSQLMLLIDESLPDRDGDGEEGAWADRLLGFRDGVIDARDTYVKVRGRLRFGVERADWEYYHGETFQTVVQGPIRAGIDVAPVGFGVSEDEMLEIGTSMFSGSATWFENRVPASPSGGWDDPPVDPALLATEAIVPGSYFPPGSPPAGVDAWEGVPFGSPGAYDFYQRPVYENMVFEDVRIPRGNNGLFINCTFIGVTFIETASVNDVEGAWNFAGAVGWLDADGDGVRDDDEFYTPRFEDPASPGDPMTAPLPDGSRTEATRDFSNNVRFHDCTFLGSVAGDRVGTDAANDFTYTHWRNKVQFTGLTRFYLSSDDEGLADEPDAAALTNYLDNNIVGDLDDDVIDDERDELAKSSILLPGWSVDAGSFDHDAPRINLKGTIVAGVLDIRGRADVHGTLLMTFRPRRGEGPLRLMGSINVDRFNTTIGYFSSGDGDSEGEEPVPGEYGEIRLRYDPEAQLPDGIPWPVSVRAVPGSFFEGGG